jgi:4-cresol dehydrogenase (hydroxylating) flavoprotein subunit
MDFLPGDEANIPADTLATALAELTEALGADAIHTEPGALSDFRDPFQPREWRAFWPGAVVQPATTGHVQAIVRTAVKHGIPVWAQGQGRNNGYGGAAPRLSGGITVNFRRMNRVIELNEDLAYALVEPGVSFQQLYDEIQERGLRLMVSVPDLGWGSLAGNSLDHGLTYLPYGKDFMAVCGLEVVTGDGSLLRTNMGAMEGNASWNLYRRSLGPSLDQLFMQSNFGIVTKVGIWLSPACETIMNVGVDVYREDDLAPLADILRRLRLDGTVDGVPCILNTLLIASTLGPRAQWYDGPADAPIPDPAIDDIARRLDVGRWHLRLALYGDEPVVDYHFGKLRAAFAAIPGARVTGAKTTPAEAPRLPSPSDRVLAGIPNLDWKDMGGWYGGEHGGHMSFAPVVPLTGERVLRLHRFMREHFEANGLDFTADIIVGNARSACSVAGITFDYENLAATEKAYRTIQELVRKAGRIGYGEYRAHLHFMDLAQHQFGFADHAYLRFVEKIKDAVDPAGVFSPGKQGIWPMALRDRRAVRPGSPADGLAEH